MTRKLGTLGAALATTTLGAGAVIAQENGSLVVTSWGGSFQDASREAIFEPFEEATGIEVIEATGPSLAKVRAMVESGNTEWDVTSITPGDLLVLAEMGYAEPLDYDNYFQGMMDDIVDEVVHPYGIGNFFYTKVIAYSTEAFPDGSHPKSWADVWDVENFPGPRMIDAGDWVVPPAEYALMADGVAPDDLYPLDLERAYDSIAKIAPNVTKFATSSAMPPQALVDGEAVVAPATMGRIAALKEQGAPVDYIYDGGLMNFDYWMIPKGAENYEAAMKFIEFATRPEIQAALVQLQPLGPVNLAAFEHVPEDVAVTLPSHPENLDKQVVLNAAWWAETGEDGQSNLERNAEMWNRWLATQ
jgi:putative spermidine/putrescine transport system substrate-binding protein